MATRIFTRAAAMRKMPRQTRSKTTVESILTASAHILGRRGWDGFTTNEVAEVAGVSIGSLYQYFPNKLALLEAITIRHLDAILVLLRAIDDDSIPFTQQVQRLVRGMIAIHSTDPALHRVLLEEAPRIRRLKSAHAVFEVEYLRCYAAVMARPGGRRDRPADQAAAEMLSAAVAGAIHDAAHRGTLRNPVLQKELADMVSAYLLRRRRRPVPRMCSNEQTSLPRPY